MSEKELTPKEEKFAQKIVELGNATEAHRQAYGGNYKDHARSVEAMKVKNKPHVAKRIEFLRQEYRQSIGVTIERVLLEKKRLAFVDVRKLFHKNGELKAIHELDDDTAAAVANIEVDTRLTSAAGRGKKPKPITVTKTAKVKLHDKGHALNDLMRHLGMFEEDNIQKADALSRLLVSMGAMNGPAPAD